jgi:hypothetical protein
MRFRPGHRQQQRILAAEFKADTGKLAAMRAKLDDPATPEHVKDGIRKRLAWADSVKPAKKRRAAGSSGEPLEADVQKACMELLASHPRVSLYRRFNSGAAYSENGALVRFSYPGIVVDLYALLKDGTSCWWECKRASWKWPATPLQREIDQRDFMDDAGACGAITGFITDPQQIMEALK